MKALVLEDIGKIVYKEIPTPKPGQGEVLLKIRNCGICSSDKDRIFKNGTYHFPTVPGHEFSGEIVELGQGVNPELLGRRAGVYPLLPCRQCGPCRSERFAQCEHYSYYGSRCDGAFAEYISVPVFNINLVPDDLDFRAAAMCEPAAVALHALRRGKMKKGDVVAIVGTGTIAILAAKIARILGAYKVILIGRTKDKIKNASQYSDHVVNSSIWDPEEAIREFTEGGMADVVLECAGNSDAVLTAMRVVARGGNVVIVGNPVEDVNIKKDVFWRILRGELNIRGTWNSSYSSTVNDWKSVISMMSDGSLDPTDLITHVYKLEEGHEAFAALMGDELYTKIMFEMG